MSSVSRLCELSYDVGFPREFRCASVFDKDHDAMIMLDDVYPEVGRLLESFGVKVGGQGTDRWGRPGFVVDEGRLNQLISAELGLKPSKVAALVSQVEKHYGHPVLRDIRLRERMIDKGQRPAPVPFWKWALTLGAAEDEPAYRDMTFAGFCEEVLKELRSRESENELENREYWRATDDGRRPELWRGPGTKPYGR